MIRLSKKAWNNVIIFTMLIMILLFNTTTNILNNSDTNSVAESLLPAESVLMTLQTNGFEIERIGSGWRVNTDENSVIEQIEPLVQLWQQSILHPVSISELPGEPVIVVAWLAGERDGRVFRLYDSGVDTLVAKDENLYIIHNTSLKQLSINQ